jgi:hypothetical protein
MAGHGTRSRLGAHLLVMFALTVPWSVVGCEGADSSKPAPAPATQGTKVQEYMKNYREQIIADNQAKYKAKAQAKAAEKKSSGQAPAAEKTSP